MGSPRWGWCAVTSQVVITGVGTSDFGRAPDARIESLAHAAIVEALNDAEVHPSEIDAVWLGTVFGPAGVANRVLAASGLAGIPVYSIEAACASGTVALHEAYAAVGTGRHRRVLAVGVEQLSTVFNGPITPEATDPEGATGLALPALYALSANRYLHDHGLDPGVLGHIAVKNKYAGSLNPRAHLGGSPPDLDHVLGSRPIAGPLTLLQCCPMSDGAAAAVLETTGTARVDDAVAMLSCAFVSGTWWNSDTALPWSVDTVTAAARQAFDTAGLTPGDVDVAELHDAFTIGEVLTTEALGLCAPGTAAQRAAEGVSALGGAQPINPSGGLLSRGHPLGATGLAQTAEIVWQLRGTAGDRQVPDAQIGLVETMGGGAAGVDGNACVVALLGGPS